MDLAVLAVAHVLLFTVWLALWIVIPAMIVVDSGRPVFYRQPRVGQGGRVFNELKFRTMVKDADQIGPAWTSANDPRLTRFGRLLRATALDELPQVVNILKGDMSFVGPRALAYDEHRHLSERAPGFDDRLRVPAGLTGLAQIYGGRHDAEQKLRHDLRYASILSLWLDLKLLFLSVWITFKGTWERQGAKL